MTEKALAVQAKSPIVGRMSMDQLRARLANTRDETGTNINQFLSYSGKKGEYFYKVDGDKHVVAIGTEVALNVLDAKKGYTCWKDGQPIDDVDRSVFEALPPKDSLEDHGPYTPPKEGERQRDGWNEYYSLPLKDVNTGMQYLLKVSSESARRAVGKLIDDILSQTESGFDFTKDVPVIKLGSKPFKANGYDNDKPTFEIVRWLKNAISTTVIEDGGASAAEATKEVAEQAEKGGMLSSLLPKSKK